jgi:hypothetical protein
MGELSDFDLLVRAGKVLGLDTSGLSKTQEESAARGFATWGTELAILAGFSTWQDFVREVERLTSEPVPRA